MGTMIEDARAAGFSDDEISTWAKSQAPTWKRAGFTDAEIGSYLTGLKEPSQIPPPFLSRLRSAATEGAQAGFGEQPVGLTPDDTEKLRAVGVFRTPGTPYTWASGLQFANEAMMRPAAAAVETMFRGVNAALMGAGAGLGEIAATATGGTQGEHEEAKRDWAQGVSIAALLAGAHTPVKRASSVPGLDETVGTLPTAQDFTNAAKAVDGGQVRPHVRDNIVQLYEKQGVHPAEVAADAARNPDVAEAVKAPPPPPEAIPAPAPAAVPEPTPAPEPLPPPTPKTVPLQAQIGDVPVTFPDRDHAALFELGRRIDEKQPIPEGEANRLFETFRDYAVSDPEYGETLAKPQDIEKLAGQYFSDLREEAAKGKPVDAWDVIEPDLIGSWYRARQDVANPNAAVHRVATPSGLSVEVRPKIVEASDLIGSTDAGYDASLQPRQRDRAAAQQQVRNIAANLDPERLGFSTEADRGAPIIGPDRMVESGNGRLAAIREAYAQERAGPEPTGYRTSGPGVGYAQKLWVSRAQRYRSWLTDQGFDVSNFKEPVLVRERETTLTPEERRAFTVSANQPSTLQLSATERALADARGISTGMLDLIRAPGDLGAIANRDFTRAFVSKLPQTEQGGMLTPEGGLSAEGLTRVRNAVIARAYGDAPALQRIAEATDDDVKSISNAMTSAAPSWAKLRADVEAGAVRSDLDLTPHLVEAVQRTADLRAKVVKLDDYLRQSDAFDRVSAPVEVFMRMFYNRSGRAASAQRIVDALRAYVEEARKVAAGEGLDLGLPPVTPEEIARAAAEKAQRGQADQSDLFGPGAGAGAGGETGGGGLRGPGPGEAGGQLGAEGAGRDQGGAGGAAPGRAAEGLRPANIPAEVPNEVFRGYGRADRAAAYNPMGSAIPILGDARYFSFDRAAAAEFGPNIEASGLGSVVKNPLVITDGEAWRKLTREAGWSVPNPFGRAPGEISADIARLRARLARDGYDGVVVWWDDKVPGDVGPHGENIKLLRNVFDSPQAVSFRPTEGASMALREPETPSFGEPPKEPPGVPPRPPDGPEPPGPGRRPYFTYTDKNAFAKAFDTALEAYKTTFQPELVSDAALRADPRFAEYVAARAGRRDRIINEADDARQFWRKVPDEQRLAYINALESQGGPRTLFDLPAGQLPPDLQALAERHRAMLDAAYKLEAEYGSKAAYLTDYFPHLWQTPDQVRQFINARAGQIGPSWFQQVRGIDLIREGLDSGLRLKSTNPEDLVTMRLLSAADMVERMRLLRDMQSMDLAIPAKGSPADMARLGWQQITAPDRQNWLIAPDIVPLWKNAVEARGLWANEGAPGSVFRGWMALKNMWVPIKLALSAFHPLHVLHIDQNNSFAHAWGQLSKGGDVIGALKSAGEGLATIPTLGMGHYRAGAALREAWLKPESARTPLERTQVRLMEEGGFVPQISEELKIKARRDLQDALDGSHWFKALPALMRRSVEVMQAPIFEKWIPALKAAAYERDAAALLQRRPDLLDNTQMRQVALRTVAKSVDNRYGEMNYGGLFWNRYVKDAGIGSFLSLGWNLGFAREFGGSVLEPEARLLRRVMRGPATEAERVKADAQNKMAFVVSYTTTAMLISGAMTYLFTGAMPQGLDWFLPRIGGTNPDGSPRRVTNMFYTREAPMLAKHVQEHGGNVVAGAGAMLWNKLMFQPVKELIENRDYYGAEIWDETSPVYNKAADAVTHFFGQQFNPMSVSGAKRALQTGGSWWEAGLAALGFGPAPSYASRTPIQNRIHYLFEQHVAPFSRSQEAGELSSQRMDIRTDLLQAQKAGDQRALQDAAIRWFKAGGSRTSLQNLLLGRGGDVAMFKALPEQDQKAILATASADERKIYDPYLKTHVARDVATMVIDAQIARETGNTAAAAELERQMQGEIQKAVQEGRITDAAAFRRSLAQEIIARRAPQLSAILGLPKRLRGQYATGVAR